MKSKTLHSGVFYLVMDESRPGHDKDTPRRRSNGERAQRLMELSKTTELRQDEKAFDNRVQELNRDEAYKYLTTLNGILRGVGRSERGVRKETHKILN